MKDITTIDFQPIRITFRDTAQGVDIDIETWIDEFADWFVAERLQVVEDQDDQMTFIDFLNWRHDLPTHYVSERDFVEQPDGGCWIFERSAEEARDLLITQIECRAIRKMLDDGDDIGACVRATRLWNRIDHSNRPGLKWRIMTRHVPEVFDDADDANSIRFTQIH